MTNQSTLETVQKSTTSVSLVSLAMLKVNSDMCGKDYIEYLRPFILHVLEDIPNNHITAIAVRDALKKEFGLVIPEAGINMMLRRLAKKNIIDKSDGIFSLKNSLPESNITQQRADAIREINTVIVALKEYSQNRHNIILSEEECICAITSFLSQFSIECIKTYVLNTALPELPEASPRNLYIVHSFIKDMHQNNVDLFNHIMVVVKGYLLSNALICPDLTAHQKNFKDLFVFIDAPMILDLLGLHTDTEKVATEKLIELIQRLGGKTVIFEHTSQEVFSILRAAETNGHFEGSIGNEILRKSITPSDIALLKGQLKERLDKFHIPVWPVPELKSKFVIDLRVLDQALDDTIGYFNPHAKEYDARSIEYIYRLRHGRAPARLEDALAVLVTKNASLAKTAFEYGKNHESARAVSTVITNYSLANVAWLKAPLGAPELPVVEVISICYAAMEPGKAMWKRYLDEIEKLKKQGNISSDDHALLRYSLQARDELMSLTMGQEEALTEESIPEILRRIKKELSDAKEEELNKERENRKRAVESKESELLSEISAHKATKNELLLTIQKSDIIQKRLYWHARIIGLMASWSIIIIAGLIIAVGVVMSLPWSTRVIIPWKWLAVISDIAVVVIAIFGLLGIIWGTTLMQLREYIERKVTAIIFKFIIGNAGDIDNA